MTLRSEEVTTNTLKTIHRSFDENRAWSKELRFRTTALIDRRLAKCITHEEYTSGRRLVDGDLAECRREFAILTSTDR